MSWFQKILGGLGTAATAALAPNAAAKQVPAVPATPAAIIQNVEAPKPLDGVVQIDARTQQEQLASESPKVITGANESPKAATVETIANPVTGSTPKATEKELPRVLGDFIRGLETKAPLHPRSQEMLNRIAAYVKTFLTRTSELVGAGADFKDLDGNRLLELYRTPLMLGVLKIAAKIAEPISPLLTALDQLPTTVMKNGKLSMAGVREGLNLMWKASTTMVGDLLAQQAFLTNLQQEPAKTA